MELREFDIRGIRKNRMEKHDCIRNFERRFFVRFVSIIHCWKKNYCSYTIVCISLKKGVDYAFVERSTLSASRGKRGRENF